MNKFYALLSVITLLLFTPFYGHTQSKCDITIKRAGDGMIVVNADLSDWPAQALLTGFSDPWNKGSTDNTRFNMLADTDMLFFYFEVDDSSLWINPFKNEMSVDLSDRVELFFAVNSSLDEYYCLEIDPDGNVLDYKGSFPRKFDRTWSIENLNISTSINEGSYIVEGSIPYSGISDINLDQQFYLGIFRADYFGDAQTDAHWFTTKEPDSPSPDFHRPDAFQSACIVDDKPSNSGHLVSDKTIKKEVIVECGLDEVWNKWTSSEGLKSFFGVDNNLEFRIGGKYEMIFLPDNPVGQQGGEGNVILSYLPKKMLSFTWNAPPQFPGIREHAHKTWVVVQFNEEPDGRIKVQLEHLGWLEGEDWDAVFDYFEKAWGVVLTWLENSCK